MSTFIEQLNEVEKEIERFLKKSKELKLRIKNDDYVNNDGDYTTEKASVKRAALDLKNELVNITQHGNFIRNKNRGR